MKQKKGLYIVIEGSDGTGKTTQAKLLRHHFEKAGRKVVLVEEPGGTPMAEKLRLLIKDKSLPRHPETNLNLFTTTRVDLWKMVIEPALADDQIVIASRNYFSTLVYQGYGEGVDLDKIQKLTEHSLPKRYCQPDIAIVLTAPDITEQRFKRLNQRQDGDFEHKADFFESKPTDFQSRIDDGYRRLAKRSGILQIDALGTPEEVFEKLLSAVLEQMQLKTA